MSKPRVLFVDDEPRILKALQRAFKQEPWELHFANSGEEALQIEAAHGPCDVLVADQRMPGMTGVELLRRFRRQNPVCVRVILSGFADVASLLDAINEGSVYKFLPKETREEVLVETLRDIVAAVELRRENRLLQARLDAQTRDVEAVEQLAREIESFPLDFAQETVLHLAIDALPVAVVVADAEHHPLYLNAEARRLLDVIPSAPETDTTTMQGLLADGRLTGRSNPFGHPDGPTGAVWVLEEARKA